MGGERRVVRMRCAGWFGHRFTLKTIPKMGYLLYWAGDCARRAPVMSDAGEDGQAPSEHDGDKNQRVETCT